LEKIHVLTVFQSDAACKVKERLIQNTNPCGFCRLR